MIMILLSKYYIIIAYYGCQTVSLLLCFLCVNIQPKYKSGPAYGIVTKTVHKTLPGGGGGHRVGVVGYGVVG